MALVATGSKSIFFRSVKVRRLYDRHSNALVYVSYADRLTVSETEDMDKK
jgi:CreA protein